MRCTWALALWTSSCSWLTSHPLPAVMVLLSCPVLPWATFYGPGKFRASFRFIGGATLLSVTNCTLVRKVRAAWEMSLIERPGINRIGRGFSECVFGVQKFSVYASDNDNGILSHISRDLCHVSCNSFVVPGV
ncbi:hypothetical protein B0H11DRAFT_2047745 [Mycena galericulata]|nr:hypothetical protein B0H11DRAFT_2047745 [Mycena galericulata]